MESSALTAASPGPSPSHVVEMEPPVGAVDNEGESPREQSRDAESELESDADDSEEARQEMHDSFSDGCTIKEAVHVNAPWLGKGTPFVDLPISRVTAGNHRFVMLKMQEGKTVRLLTGKGHIGAASHIQRRRCLRVQMVRMSCTMFKRGLTLELYVPP